MTTGYLRCAAQQQLFEELAVRRQNRVKSDRKFVSAQFLGLGAVKISGFSVWKF
jgi:hypothetical protein